MKYFDISPTIHSSTAVFPGDTPFSRNESMAFSQGHHLSLSSMTTTLHIGAHADAPNHYHPEGVGIDQQDLRTYYGQCQVLSIDIARGQRILPQHIEGVSLQSERILFRTGSFPNPNQWNSDFNSLSPELISSLAQQKVCLVGIDTPSIDPADSKALESHKAVYENDLAILEGIVLDEVPDGLYTLVALPLKLQDADASPVRAILVCE